MLCAGASVNDNYEPNAGMESSLATVLMMILSSAPWHRGWRSAKWVVLCNLFLLPLPLLGCSVCSLFIFSSSYLLR